MNKEQEVFKKMLKKSIDQITVDTMVKTFNNRDMGITIKASDMWEMIRNDENINKGFHQARRMVMEIIKDGLAKPVTN